MPEIPRRSFILLLLFLSVFSLPSAALTSNATITITNSSGAKIVDSQTMNCTYVASGTAAGFSFDSQCGVNTSSPTLINRSNVSCTYIFSKNYSSEGAWTANATFYHSAYENTGVGIITTNGTVDPKTPIDTDTTPTGYKINDCTANTTCYSDPQCNNTINETSSQVLYTINWDTTSADCVGYGKLWYPGQTSGSNYYCCGDDAGSDQFAYWSGSTCMYCNAGVNTSAGTNCTYPNTNCTATSTCRGGSEDYCCYNVGCSYTGATVSSTNMVGGNCTCEDAYCYCPGCTSYCFNVTWGGAGCYYGTTCSSTGWTWTTYDAPPKQPTNSSTIPAFADPETVVNVTAVVNDYAPLTGNLRIWVDPPSASSPSGALCMGNSVANGSNSSCTFTASSAGCSAGTCQLKLTVDEVNNDPCGDSKQSYPFYSLSFTYRDRSLSTPVLNAPTTDPNITVGNNFTLNCTPITGNASTGINMSFQFNSTTADWANISSTGSLITTQTNPVTNVINATAYAINVTGNAAGTYWVRCQAYNSTYWANSTAKQVTVNNISTNLSQSASPASPKPYGTQVTFSCNYSNASNNAPLTDATVYVNIGGVDFSTTYSNGNYTYSNNSLPYGNNQWYCRASKTNYSPQTGSTQTYTISSPTINTTATSYSSCGAVPYKVSLYDVNSKLIDSYFSLKVIDPSTTTLLTQAALYPNNGTGIYLGSYALNASSQLGTWLLKVTDNSGISGGKNFYVTTTCGEGVCTGGENCTNCATDCGACYCGDSLCTSGENCESCAADCGACYCGDGLCTAEEDCHYCVADCGCTPPPTCRYCNGFYICATDCPY